MELNEQVVKLICDKFKGHSVYIGADIARKTPAPLLQAIRDNLKEVGKLEKTTVLIENEVANYCTPIVFTDGAGNSSTSLYEQHSINKALNVSMFVRRRDLHTRLRNNPYVYKNLYNLNKNGKLFEVRVQRVPIKKSVPICALYNQFQDHRLVIVGGGASWLDIDWSKKAKDIRVMIVNYNFKLKADFLIYNDKQVGRDLENVFFYDKRVFIGYKNHTSRVTDYVYEIPKDVINVTHTGAMAIQLAEKMGFQKVYLAGFDYKQTKDGKDQVYLKDKNNYYKDSRINRFINDFDRFKTERTFNLNKESNLQKLPFADVEEFYEPNS